MIFIYFMLAIFMLFIGLVVFVAHFNYKKNKISRQREKHYQSIYQSNYIGVASSNDQTQDDYRASKDFNEYNSYTHSHSSSSSDYSGGGGDFGGGGGGSDW